jgi:outer membrane immunogenic protein
VTRSYIVVNGSSTYAPTTVNITSTGTADMSTYGTVRGRLGWALGNFLPYLVAGISFAQIDSSRFVDVSYFGIDITPQSGNPPSPVHVNVGGNYPFADVSHGKYIAGFDAALGTDYLVTQNIFTRAEVEFLHLGTPNEIRLSAVSAPLGAQVAVVLQIHAVELHELLIFFRNRASDLLRESFRQPAT